MGRSTDAGSETVRGTSGRCGALSVSAAPRPARLSGSVRITMGALFQSSIFRSDLDRGTERTAARIIAGSERYRLVIPLHRSARAPRMGGGDCKAPALFVALDWSRSCRPRVPACRNYCRFGYGKPLLPGRPLCWPYPGAKTVQGYPPRRYFAFKSAPGHAQLGDRNLSLTGKSN